MSLSTDRGTDSRSQSRGVGGQPPASPPATRRRTSLWRDPRLLVGVALVTGSALVGALLLSDEEPAQVWAVRESMTAGEPLRVDALVRREVRFADQAGADRYLSADQELPSGATLAHPVGAGELLPRSALADVAGETVVEVPLAVPGESVPMTVRPGSLVDVWVTSDPGSVTDADEPGRARLALSDVRVLAVSRAGTALGPAATRQVIVGLQPEQEGRLGTALADIANGSVVLVRKP